MSQYPPHLDELTARFLARRQADPESVAMHADVEAYEAVPAQSVDPRQAWDGGFEALSGLVDPSKNAKLPSGWATLVAGLESISGLPMAAANFPQAVRDLLPLVRAAELSATLTSNNPAPDVAGLNSYVEKSNGDPGKRLLAAGLLRLARRFDEAEQLLNSPAPNGWETAWANEQAALAWQRGNHHLARDIWTKLPETPATVFNRGMSELFLGDAAAARANLKSAANRLPESSGWHHLARLYLALAESR